MFATSWGCRGFHLKFPNGVTLSTQFGPGNYGDNYKADFDEKPKNGYQSTKAEIAIWTDEIITHIVFDEERKSDRWITHLLPGKFKVDRPYMIDDESNWEPGKFFCSIGGWIKFEDWLEIFDWCKNLDVNTINELERTMYKNFIKEKEQ